MAQQAANYPECQVCHERLAPGHVRAYSGIGGIDFEVCPGGQPFNWRAVFKVVVT